MATLASIREDLSYELGLGTLDSFLTNLTNHAINVAVRSLAMDKVAGITRRTMTAETWGDLALTGWEIAAVGDNFGTDTGETWLSDNVFAGDIIEFNSTRWTIYEVTSDTVINIGSPQRATFAAGVATIYRRAVELVDPGRVMGVSLLSSTASSGSVTKALEHRATAAHLNALATGTPTEYTVSYDQGNTKAMVQVYPAPKNQNLRLQIHTMEIPAVLDASTDLDWPTVTLDAVRAKARELILTYTKEQNPEVLKQAKAMRADAADQFFGSSDGERSFTVPEDRTSL